MKNVIIIIIAMILGVTQTQCSPNQYHKTEKSSITKFLNLDIYEERDVFRFNATIGASAIDRINNLIVAGSTSVATLPVKNAFQDKLAGDEDGFIAKINPDGEIVWCSYLGGYGNDHILEIFIDAEDQIHVLGITNSKSFKNLANSKNDSKFDENSFFQATLSLDGKFISKKKFQVPGINLSQNPYIVIKLIATEENTLMILDPNSLSTPIVNSMQNSLDNYSYCLVLLDSSYEMMWSKLFNKNNIETVFDVTFDKKEEQILIAGEAHRNATLLSTDYAGKILWHKELYNKDQSKVSSVLKDSNDLVYALIQVDHGYGAKPRNSVYIQILDSYGQVLSKEWLPQDLSFFYRYAQDRNLHFSINHKNDLAFLSGLSIFNDIDEIHQLPLINPYQITALGSENKTRGNTNILFHFNSEKEINYSTFYGGTYRSFSFYPMDIKLANSGHLYIRGFIVNLNLEKEGYANHLDIPSEVFGMENQIAFVSVFNPEGQKTGIVFFGVDE